MTDSFETRRDASDGTPNAPATRRARREMESRRIKDRGTAHSASTAPRKTPTTASQKQPRSGKSIARSWASTAIVGLVVPGLFATMALPSYATPEVAGDGPSSYDIATASAQTLDASGVAVEPALNLVRDSYGATTTEELEAAREAAAAEAAAKRAAEQAKKSSSSNAGGGNVYSAIAGDGTVRWPLPSRGTIGDGFMSRGGSHEGVDILIAGGTPIGAVADGVVVTSQESYGGYGVAVVVEHQINGQTVTSTYGHMTYGSRQVSVGQHVSAGQVLGLVGSTGRSTANHLHLEIRINGGLVNPLSWLSANGAY
ncbi:M23 family metallopeptidase [Paramicrobacterium agarici]|uniref:Murein DD-endopeptidase MepM/ murein hydrolase activator NlpD n=1 Tax=Paramicrobacterium agarici TaxID=630514 RepID=A0A2A9DWD8_9MICO|nr:M23 family metallopeptidase [Microbacterium agarici]PFG30913.1 murein DD-endopeptidase MepM/ murein hydrolase activator NlpD [Microbacterium agarici]